MSYIKSYGIALPYYRVDDTTLHPKGRKNNSRTICYTDEDIITLAYEAAKECLTKCTDEIDALFFATSNPVFHNRYHASFLADLLGIPVSLFCLDFMNTTKSGTDALLMANDLVNAGKYKNILVVTSDVDFPGIGEELFSNIGHASCALLINNKKGIAEIKKAFTVNSFLAEEFTYKNNFIRLDSRFSREEGFKKNMLTVANVIKDLQSSSDKIILNSLYSKLAGPVFIKSGFSDNQFSRDSISQKTGNTGATHALLLLLNEIENGSKNNLLIDYANGSNVLQIQLNENIECKFIQSKLSGFHLVNSYQDYLLLRKEGNFNSLKYKTREMFSSEMMNEREKESFLHLKGMKCDKCGTSYYIKIARCKKCKGEKFKTIKLSDKGKVYSFTSEHYFPVSFPPVTMLVIDLEGGGRVTVQQTNTMYPDMNSIQIGSEVKLVLRKMIEHDQKPNYFFKAIAVS